MDILKLGYIAGCLGHELGGRRARRRVEQELLAFFRGQPHRCLELKRVLLQQTLEQARRLIPFYRERIDPQRLARGDLSEILTELPVISRGQRSLQAAAFVRPFPALVAKRFNTGGSTGDPLVFYCSPLGRELELAHQNAFYARCFGEKNPAIVSFDGVQLSDQSRARSVYWQWRKRHHFPYGAMRFSAGHIQEDTIAVYRQKLGELRAPVLRGYPSALLALARELQAKGWDLGYQPQMVMLTSETIWPDDIDYLRRVFGCDVYPQYGHSEGAIFGFAAANSLEYWCSPLMGVTEVLGADGRQVKVGETGEIVVTGFGNFASPFIRYRTGDLGVYNGEEGGFARISRLLGREQDFVVDRRGVNIPLVGPIFGAHLSLFGQAQHLQIIDHGAGCVEVAVLARQPVTAEAKSELTVRFREFGEFTVTVNEVQALRRLPNGKAPFCIRTPRSNGPTP